MRFAHVSCFVLVLSSRPPLPSVNICCVTFPPSWTNPTNGSGFFFSFFFLVQCTSRESDASLGMPRPVALQKQVHRTPVTQLSIFVSRTLPGAFHAFIDCICVHRFHSSRSLADLVSLSVQRKKRFCSLPKLTDPVPTRDPRVGICVQLAVGILGKWLDNVCRFSRL